MPFTEPSIAALPRPPRSAPRPNNTTNPPTKVTTVTTINTHQMVLVRLPAPRNMLSISGNSDRECEGGGDSKSDREVYQRAPDPHNPPLRGVEPCATPGDGKTPG